ncbi:DUF4192 domain-containing protein [Actinosynnema sp. NPDC051121]
MDLPQYEHVDLTDPGELIAAIPYLLGFHPSRAFILVTFADEDDAYRLLGVVGIDLPQPEDHVRLAHRFAAGAVQHDATAAALVVIGEGEPNLPSPLPEPHLIAAMTHELRAHGLDIVHTVWAAATASASLWRCYGPPEWSGVVPDPAQTAVAAATVAAGRVTFASRAELLALLAPDHEPILRSRAARIHQLLAETAAQRRVAGNTATRDSFNAVQAAIDAAHHGHLVLDEPTLTRLGVALSDDAVRDAHLAITPANRADAAEQLWIALTKALPAPYRAEPALLLAMSAYLRGDGVLAGVALGSAEEADPDNLLILLLRMALGAALPPHVIAPDVAEVVVAAEWFIRCPGETAS